MSGFFMATKKGKIADAASSSRWKDAINALHAGKSVITKAGVDEYLGKDLPFANLDPHKFYRIYRPPDVIRAALPAMRNLRILNGHHFETADSLAQDKLIGTTGDHPEMQGDAALINVTIWNGQAIRDIESRTKEQLSLGAETRMEMTPGTAPDGRPYDGIITQITPEHVALVPVGRVNHPGNSGPIAKIADEKDTMDLDDALIALQRACPDTPADVVRAKITSLIADINTEEAASGAQAQQKTGDAKTPPLSKATGKTEDFNEGSKRTGSFAGHASHSGRAGRTGTNTTGLGFGPGGWNHEAGPGDTAGGGWAHDSADNTNETNPHTTIATAVLSALSRFFGKTEDQKMPDSQKDETKEDDKETRMKKARLDAKSFLDKGLHPEAIALHLEKSHTLPKEDAQELVKRAHDIPASEGKKELGKTEKDVTPSKDTSKTKDEEERKRKEEIRREVEEQRKKEREEDEKKRKQADEARDDVEKETGRLHGCKTGDSAADLYRVGLANLGYQGADTLPEAALQSTFRSFAAQRQQGSAHLGDSAENAQNTANVQTLARELLG